MNDYIEQHGGGYRVKGTRVSLDSIILRFREGLSPESIQRDCFPVLDLEQVYGAITYYLAHREELDHYLKLAAQEERESSFAIRQRFPEIHQRLDQILKDAESAEAA